MALMYAHVNSEPPPIESVRPDCPERLRLAVTRMLAKDPAARWPSMEAAVKAVGGLGLNTDDPTRSKLVELAKTGSMARMVARAQTPRSPVPVARSQTQGEPAAAITAERPYRRWLIGAAGLVIAAGLVGTTYLVSRPHSNPSPPAVTPTGPTAPSAVPIPPPEATAPAKAAATGSVPPASPVPAPLAGRRTPATVAAEPNRVPDPPGVETNALVPRSPVDSAVVLRVSPPSVSSSAALVPAPASMPTVPDARKEIEAVLVHYGQALESGDIARVRRAYPGITAAQLEGLAAFYAAGGAFATSWTIQDVMVAGDTATARIVGTNRVTVPRARATEQPVDLKARLERQSAGWRLISVVN
jgi:serine/threonine-protein kinase